jgi:hypothetical protein
LQSLAFSDGIPSSPLPLSPSPFFLIKKKVDFCKSRPAEPEQREAYHSEITAKLYHSEIIFGGAKYLVALKSCDVTAGIV